MSVSSGQDRDNRSVREAIRENSAPAFEISVIFSQSVALP